MSTGLSFGAELRRVLCFVRPIQNRVSEYCAVYGPVKTAGLLRGLAESVEKFGGLDVLEDDEADE